MQRMTQDAMLAIVFLIGVAAVLAGCGAGSVANPPPPPVSNPAPAVASLSPASAIAQGNGFTLTVNESNFTSSTIIHWNGQPIPSTFVSSQQMTATVAATLIASAGSDSVSAENGNSSESNAIQFVVNAAPGAQITSLSPSTAVAGSGPFVLTVNGSNFASSVTVHWNGQPVPTTFVSSAQVIATISASLIVSAGGDSVSV